MTFRAGGILKRPGGARVVGFDPQTLTYSARVQADGGTIQDLAATDRLIKDLRALGLLTSATALFLSAGGVKLRSSGVTNYVTKWYDVSGNANDATQGTAADQPPLATGPNGGSYLSLAALQYMTFTPASISQPFTMIARAKRTANFTTQQNFLAGPGTACAMFFANSANTLGYYSGLNVSVGSVADNSWHLMGAVFNGASSMFYYDGTGSHGPDNPGAQALGTSLGIGANPDGTAPVTGGIAEVLIFSGARSDGEFRAINSLVGGAP